MQTLNNSYPSPRHRISSDGELGRDLRTPRCQGFPGQKGTSCGSFLGLQLLRKLESCLLAAGKTDRAEYGGQPLSLTNP